MEKFILTEMSAITEQTREDHDAVKKKISIVTHVWTFAGQDILKDFLNCAQRARFPLCRTICAAAVGAEIHASVDTKACVLTAKI